MSMIYQLGVSVLYPDEQIESFVEEVHQISSSGQGFASAGARVTALAERVSAERTVGLPLKKIALISAILGELRGYFR